MRHLKADQEITEDSSVFKQPITVSVKNIGKIVITPQLNLSNQEKYAVKSLAMLQTVCMNPNEKEHFPEFLKIISEAIDKAHRLYGMEEDNASPTQLF
jgi:hypothetical protein